MVCVHTQACPSLAVAHAASMQEHACAAMRTIPPPDGHACAQPLDPQFQLLAGPSQTRFGARALEVQRVARPELVVSRLHICCPLVLVTAETRRRTAAGREELGRMRCARPPLAFAVRLRVSPLLRRSPSRPVSVSPPCSVARPLSRFVYAPHGPTKWSKEWCLGRMKNKAAGARAGFSARWSLARRMWLSK